MTCEPDNSSKSFNHEERCLWILFFIMCKAHFARDVRSLIFKTYVNFVLWRNDLFLLCVVKWLQSRIVVTYYYDILTRNIMDVTYTSHYDIVFNWSYSCVYACMPMLPLSTYINGLQKQKSFVCQCGLQTKK